MRRESEEGAKAKRRTQSEESSLSLIERSLRSQIYSPSRPRHHHRQRERESRADGRKGQRYILFSSTLWSRDGSEVRSAGFRTNLR
jgi:hypothetical protein